MLKNSVYVDIWNFNNEAIQKIITEKYAADSERGLKLTHIFKKS